MSCRGLLKACLGQCPFLVWSISLCALTAVLYVCMWTVGELSTYRCYSLTLSDLQTYTHSPGTYPYFLHVLPPCLTTGAVWRYHGTKALFPKGKTKKMGEWGGGLPKL